MPPSEKTPTARKHIVIAIDFSDASRRVLDAGIKLAKDLDADITLAHAFTSSPWVPAMTETSAKDAITELRLEMEIDEAIQLTTDWASQVRKEGINVETVAREGPAREVVLDAAKQADATLILVGRHGWGGFKRFILGSVAQDIVKRSQIPVLVVPTPRV